MNPHHKKEGYNMKRISLLIVALGLLFSVTACIPNFTDRNPAVSSEPAPTLQPVEKILSSFTPVQGTNYLVAAVINAPVSREGSLINPLEWINNSSRYSSYSSSTYNYVFFNLSTEEYKRLLPSNEYAIFQTSGFPISQIDPANPQQPVAPVEWWIYSIIKKDTNKDGSLGYEDKLTISIADVGGNGYTELIENVDSVLSQIYRNSSSLFIIYNADQKNYIAKINPATREVISTTEMNLGEDVK
jgi:hypothetical protein